MRRIREFAVFEVQLIDLWIDEDAHVVHSPVCQAVDIQVPLSEAVSPIRTLGLVEDVHFAFGHILDADMRMLERIDTFIRLKIKLYRDATARNAVIAEARPTLHLMHSSIQVI